MNFDELARRSGHISSSVIAKAREYQRLTEAKKTCCGSQSLCLAPACLYIAAVAEKESIDLRKLCSVAGAKYRQTEQTIQQVVNAVGKQNIIRLSTTALCIRYGCSSIVTLVTAVNDDYREVALRLLRNRRGARDCVQNASKEYNDPVYAAACLYACNKEALVRDVLANEQTFDSILTSIEYHCKDIISGVKPIEIKKWSQESDSTHSARSITTGTEVLSMDKIVKETATIKRKNVMQATSITLKRKMAIKAASRDEYLQWRQLVLKSIQAARE
ncbi:unnamed protein product [Albugo candida]|uniref:Origin recognition complex subunit 6 n=1 Tax=Albugo candida TaxID=65357 RepID=A0A024GPR9_9STRA|nr:unnamed protein product [Albugo candida]|eukprot:CCI48872.1 unnamed protein product [Albugo candida]